MLNGRGVLATLDAGFASFLDRVDSGGGETAFSARNAVLDERVTRIRAEEYTSAGAVRDHGDFAEWNAAHGRYMARYVGLPWASRLPPVGALPPNECATTFHPGVGNEASLANDLMVVRLSRFPRAIDIPVGYANFVAAVRRVVGQSAPDLDDVQTVNDGLHLWGSGPRRTVAPEWVALWMEIRELFGADATTDDPAWPNVLRDRLGLHWRPNPRSVDVILWRYRVRDLPSAVWDRRRHLLAVPSILDGWLYPYFCPAPAEDRAGRVINLQALGDAPNQEFLHPPIRHEASHLFRVGTVDRDPASPLSPARSIHLDRVRVINRRPDYGLGTDS